MSLALKSKPCFRPTLQLVLSFRPRHNLWRAFVDFLWIMTKRKSNSLKTYPYQGSSTKAIPYLWPKRLKNHTLWDYTYLYSPYKGVSSPPELQSIWLVKNTLLVPNDSDLIMTLIHWMSAVRSFSTLHQNVLAKELVFTNKNFDAYYFNCTLDLMNATLGPLWYHDVVFKHNKIGITWKLFYDVLPKQWNSPCC